MTRDEAIKVMAEALNAETERDDLESLGYEAMVAGLVDRLWQGGAVLAKVESDATAPDWAEALLDTMFTGKPLDFDGLEIPPWLQSRLEAEYGHPYPVRPPTGPVIDESDLDLGIMHDRTLD